MDTGAMKVNANGTVLYVEQVGSGAPVVFVHGMCGDARAWAGQVDRLAGRHHCVSYDRRGHSRSPAGDQPWTVQLHADDLAGLIEALALDRPVVVGSSGGARVALDLLVRHPHLVRAAVLSEPPVGSLAPDLFPAFVGEVGPAVQQAMADHGPRAAVDAFFEVVCPGLWQGIDDPVKDRYRDNASALFADLEMPRYEITEDEVASIQVPTTVIAGSKSHPALRTAAENLAAWLPDASLVVLDTGHVTYFEDPDGFANAVAGLAARL